MANRQRIIFAFLLLGAMLCAYGASLPQTETPAGIAAQSDVVVIPALVVDKSRMERPLNIREQRCLETDLGTFSRLSPRAPYFPDDCDESLIRGLKNQEFHLFEDGVEQKVVKVSVASWAMTVRDNFAFHTEVSLTPAGKWSTPQMRGHLPLAPASAGHWPDIPRILGLNAARPLYWIAYVRSKPLVAGCRKIEVKVDRSNARVFTWDESCFGQSLSDPLAGTKFGREIEHNLLSGAHGKLDLSLQVGSFRGEGNEARVVIALDLPFRSLDHDWKMNWTKNGRIGLVGRVFGKDGVPVTGFSDLACCSSFSPVFGSRVIPGKLLPPVLLDQLDDFLLPSRFEAQIALPTGDYVLKVALRDETNFGRVEAPLTIPKYDEKELGLSSVVLCNRFQDADVAAAEFGAANFASRFVPLVSPGKYAVEVSPPPTSTPTLSRRQEVVSPANIRVTPNGGARFAVGEPVIPYFEIYEPLLAGDAGAKVNAQVRILDEKSGKLVDDSAIDAIPFMRPGASVIPIARQIPPSKLPKGVYRLEVQATDSAGRSTAVRMAEFTVE